jgi:hypothetical protein
MPLAIIMSDSEQLAEAESARQEVGRTLLVIVISVAGTLGLLVADGGAHLWSWKGARFLVALAAICT